MTPQEHYQFEKRLAEVTSREINYKYVDWKKIPRPLFIDVDKLKQCNGVTGPCESFGIKQRQNTRYENDESNFSCLCAKCQDANDEYWDGMWREYYAGCM